VLNECLCDVLCHPDTPRRPSYHLDLGAEHLSLAIGGDYPLMMKGQCDCMGRVCMHDSAMWRDTVYFPVCLVFIRRLLGGFSIKRNKNKFAGGIQKRSGACY
jgi:hypothetical protein